MGGDGNHGVRALLNVLELKLLDQTGLDSGTANGKLRGVDCSGRCGGRQDGCGIGKSRAKRRSDLWCVGVSASKNDFRDIERVEFGLLDSVGDEAGEGCEELVAKEIVARAVDGCCVVDGQ